MLPRGQTVPVFCGSAAGTPFKQGAEIGRIIVARQIADLIHLDLRIRQKFFGLFYPDRGQKINIGFPGFLFKNIAEITGTDGQGFSYMAQMKPAVRIVFLNIGFGIGNNRVFRSCKTVFLKTVKIGNLADQAGEPRMKFPVRTGRNQFLINRGKIRKDFIQRQIDSR